MKLHYFVKIDEPHTHMIKVTMTGTRPSGENKLSFFMPSWCPGSYLMREYARNIRNLRGETPKGETLYFEQTAKGVWEFDWERSDLNQQLDDFVVSYEVYAHEVSVRTSYVDNTHAFLHGPSVFLGVKDQPMEDLEVELSFSPLWAKVATGLKDISPSREVFKYYASDYDVLVDAPIEIGCHLSDGFMVDGKEHHLAFYGGAYDHGQNLKADIKTIVEKISKTFGEIPYDTYHFITHFIPKQYGGLEHLNSTVLIYDGRKLTDRKSYLQWLALVSHEYFHTWNVKRIRPKELGPFDYLNENYTTMHWLTEGLTSFMDEYFVYRSGLCSLEEYMEFLTANLKRYYATPGKKYHSLEQSSFNTWIKLYRPDENSANSSISYYLKGGLVFMQLHLLLKNKGQGIDNLLSLLWQSYKKSPMVGLESKDVYAMIENLGGAEVREEFERMISTTEDIDFETPMKKVGLEFDWEQSEKAWLGANHKFEGDRVFISSVVLDGPAYQSGLNAGDEILAINGLRFTTDDSTKFTEMFKPHQTHVFLISRQSAVFPIEVHLGVEPKQLRGIKVLNRELAEKAFSK